jgi:hypothetical protein
MSSPWNEFRKKHKGKNYTLSQLSAMYRSTVKGTPTKYRSTVKGTPTQSPFKKKDLVAKEKRRVGVTTRKNRTSGWKIASPKKGKERSNLMKKCGRECFLEPKTLGFPICSPRNKNPCKIDCRGVASAKIRAAQYKRTHPGTLRKAVGVQKRYGC